MCCRVDFSGCAPARGEGAGGEEWKSHFWLSWVHQRAALGAAACICSGFGSTAAGVVEHGRQAHNDAAYSPWPLWVGRNRHLTTMRARAA